MSPLETTAQRTSAEKPSCGKSDCGDDGPIVSEGVAANAVTSISRERDVIHFTYRGCIAAGLVAAFGLGSSANADIFNEGATDAGSLVGNAHTISGIAGTSVDSFFGVLGNNLIGSTADDVDLIQIYISDPANFSAYGRDLNNTGDVRLLLFDHNGFGVSYRDDVVFGDPDAILNNSFITTPGIYYLAITSSVIMATSSSGDIWDNFNGSLTTERQPDGIGALDVLSGWTYNNPGGPTGTYQIDFTAVTVVPAPATTALMATAALAFGVSRRRTQY